MADNALYWSDCGTVSLGDDSLRKRCAVGASDSSSLGIVAGTARVADGCFEAVRFLRAIA